MICWNLGNTQKNYIRISKSINKTSINNVNVIGKDIKDTYKNLNKSKKGLIIKKNHK